MHLLSPSSSDLYFVFLLWAGGWTVIDYDLRRTSWERKRGRRFPWYSRFIIHLGILLIIGGLLMLANSTFPLSSPFPLNTQLMLIVLLLLFFLIIGIYALCAWVYYGSAKAWNEAVNIGTGPVEVNPLIAREHFYLILCLFWLLIGARETLSDILITFPSKPLSLNFCVSATFLLIGALIVFRLSNRQHILKRLEQRRLALAAEWRPDYDSYKPANGEQSYPLMSTISLRFKRTTIALWFMIALAILLSFLLSMPSVPVDGSFQILIWLILGIVTIPVALGFVNILRTHKTVESTINALETREGSISPLFPIRDTSTKTTIAWEEARLFACYRLPGLFFGRRNTAVFELSSPDKVVQWTWVLDTQTLCQLWETMLSAPEYHQHMQALSDLVSAKTGLQLHDLSEERKLL